MSSPAAAATSRLLTLGRDRPTIEVLEAGQGTPLLFLHGAGGVPAWEGVLPLLSREYHVYAPLLPGFGRSTGLELLDDQLDLFLHGFDVLQALGLDRPCVVGESMGGWMAAEMAALRPDKIGRLVLVAPLGLWRDHAPIADLFGMMNDEMVPYLFHDATCAAARAMRGLSALTSTKDDRSEEQIETLISLARGARTAAKFLFPIPEGGLERRLWRIQAPTLILWGTNDRFAPPLYAEIFAQQIANARVVKVPNAGHLVGLEAPEPYAAALRSWAGR